ncbi:MAG TPA: ABC transporter permease subunit [Chthonomonadaceae bacterium]|nr:ABC transporter permease subunit [Chthonomonadaceae bacterium]
MAVFTIAGLTLKEAVRRRTLLGALMLGLLVLGLSLLLLVIRYRMEAAVASGHMSVYRYAIQFPIARSTITSLCLSSIKMLSALFAVMLAGGAISSEIERGLLAVILPKPIYRVEILLGKWIGINIVLVGSVLVWTTMVWASLTWQVHQDMTALLHAGCYLALFPVVVSTLSLMFSTFAPRLFGMALALVVCAFAWFDGIFNALGDKTAFDVESLRQLADVAGLVVPQGTIGWWVEGTTRDIIVATPRGGLGNSPQFLKHWGLAHLHFAHLDAVYVVFYVLALFLLGAVIFHLRDV